MQLTSPPFSEVELCQIFSNLTEISFKMAAAKTESIDEIDDIFEMLDVMMALDIPQKGLLTLQDMKDLVKSTIDQSSRSPSWSAGQVRML